MPEFLGSQVKELSLRQERLIADIEIIAPGYGDISVIDNASGQVVAAGVAEIVDQFDTNGLSVNTTPDHANDKITLTLAGDYILSASVSFNHSANNTLTGFQIVVNSVTTGITPTVDTGNASLIYFIGYQIMVNIATAGLDIELFTVSDTNGTIVVSDAQLSAQRIG